jgi:4-diphosphocytidyl-2-C-methyl-D-erythritol kinase
VTGRRADGYHLLESILVPFDLEDDVELVLEPGFAGPVELALEGAPAELAGEDPAANLAVRAALAYLDAAQTGAALHVTLRKRIPMGAGLGGGSSDAAAVLRGLAALLGGRVAPERLAALAASLGADVPFFLARGPARVGGIGERIEPLAGVPSFPVVVVTPAPPLRTAEVFRAYDAETAALTRAEPGRTMPALPDVLDDLRVDDARSGAALLVNDLEPVATRLRPSIGRVRTELRRGGARAVGMSGSGPSVFGIFAEVGAAEAAVRDGRFEPSDRIHVGRTVGSPRKAG